MNPHDHQSPKSPGAASIREQAASWLARRDRGLTPAEQDEYILWLGADPLHAEAMAQHAGALERMMQLYEWQPAHDTEPNPDLFLPRRRPAWSRWSVGLAAAAALVFVAYLTIGRAPAPGPVAAAPKSYLHVNDRLALPDGSRIELKDGSRVVVQYSDTERRVKLNGGEAHFTVWKDKTRPFVVDVGGIEVRAVGTAFNVRLEPGRVEVLVTEGRVAVQEPAGQPLAGVPPSANPGMTIDSPTYLSVNQRAVIDLAESAPAVVSPVTSEEINRDLAWQAPRLQFAETRLADAVAEFNRLNRHQIVIADPELTNRLIGGTFRPDNVEGFIRLLGTTLGIQAEKSGENTTVLRRGP